jgi:hypothetical protein
VPRYEKFYTYSAMASSPGLVEFDTGCGKIRIASPETAAQLLGDVALPDWHGDSKPHGIAITVATPKLDELEKLWEACNVRFVKTPSGSYVISPEQCGNVIMEFVRS